MKQYIEAYRNSLADDVFSDSQYSFRVFLIPQLCNHRSSSDCAVEFVRYDPEHPEEFESIKKNIALIKEKRIPVANQGRYKPQMVCDALSEKLGKKITLLYIQGLGITTKLESTVLMQMAASQSIANLMNRIRIMYIHKHGLISCLISLVIQLSWNA